MISALYVQPAPRGCYHGLPNVDPWDAQRDARLYAGPWPVVAHPPCSVFCGYARLNESRYGHKVGEDDGCFAAALASVRKWGGVLEHPAYTLAWPMFGLPRPDAKGGWTPTPCGGWVCHVEQCHYGHRARKATWLYACNTALPELRWGKGVARAWCTPGASLKVARGKPHVAMSKRERQATPSDFRDLLISIAESCSAERVVANDVGVADDLGDAGER